MNDFLATVLAGFFDGWEIVLILAMILLLFGSKRLPELLRGLKQGMTEFKKALREILDRPALDAGQSLGGIFSKPAAEALTPANQVAELYKPAVFGEKEMAYEKAKTTLTRRFFFLRRLIIYLSFALARLIRWFRR
jgi:sec-independent protein translocase protein TatA